METSTVTKGFAIVVLDRGFVYVGDVAVDDKWCVITNPRNIRKYGTTNGLGELARNGPTSKTLLDSTETIRAPLRALNHLMESDADKWN